MAVGGQTVTQGSRARRRKRREGCVCADDVNVKPNATRTDKDSNCVTSIVGTL